MIEISLVNPRLTPFWFILGTDISLNYDKPGPLEIDETKLDKLQREELKTAIQSNVIKLKGLDVQVSFAQTREQIIAEQRFERIKKMQLFLQQKLKTLKQSIPGMSIIDLRILLEEENLGKARKSVLKVLQDSISKYQAEIFKKAGNISPILNKEEQWKDLKSILGKAEYIENIELEELESEEVTILIGASE
jgi:hypothetical protein